MPSGKYILRGPAFHLHRRLLLPAVGVCEDQLCVFCGHHVLPFHGFLRPLPVTTAAAAAHVLVLAASRDLGNALIYFVSYLMMLFVATSNWFYLGAGAAGGAGAAVAAYHMFSHVRRRVQAGGIPGPTWMTSDTRQPSPCLPSVQADGSAWDFTRECRKRSRWWIRTLFFQQFLRSWAGSMPFVFYLSAWLLSPVHADRYEDAGHVL